MTNDIYGSDSAVPSGLGLLLHHPTLERVGYSRASLRERGFRSVVQFDQWMAEKCPNSSGRRDAAQTRSRGRLRYAMPVQGPRRGKEIDCLEGVRAGILKAL